MVDVICRITDQKTENKIISCGNNKDAIQIYQYAQLKEVKPYCELFSMPIAPSIFVEIYRALKHDDVVCLHYPFPFADVCVALFGFFSKSRVVVYWHSNIVSQKFLKWLVLPFTYLMLLRADQVAVASPPMLSNSKLLKRFEDKVKIIPYSIGFNDIKLKNSTVREGRYFLAIGRHVGYKGFSMLIEAMRLNESSLIIVGDGVLFQKHKNMLDKYFLNDRVSLLKDVSNIQKEELLANCKALILPSVYPSEAFALVQLEAMKYGKPVINTKLTTGVPWVARHGSEGLSVTVGDISELNSAINALEVDSSLRKKLGSQAQRRISEVFNTKHFEEKIFQFFNLG